MWLYFFCCQLWPERPLLSGAISAAAAAVGWPWNVWRWNSRWRYFIDSKKRLKGPDWEPTAKGLRQRDEVFKMNVVWFARFSYLSLSKQRLFRGSCSHRRDPQDSPGVGVAEQVGLCKSCEGLSCFFRRPYSAKQTSSRQGASIR